jgi:hypothetical protein
VGVGVGVCGCVCRTEKINLFWSVNPFPKKVTKFFKRTSSESNVLLHNLGEDLSVD